MVSFRRLAGEEGSTGRSWEATEVDEGKNGMAAGEGGTVVEKRELDEAVGDAWLGCAVGLKGKGEAVEGAVLVRTAALRRVARSGRALLLLMLHVWYQRQSAATPLHLVLYWIRASRVLCSPA